MGRNRHKIVRGKGATGKWQLRKPFLVLEGLMAAHSPALAGVNPDMPTCCCPVPRLRTGPRHRARAMVPSGTPKTLKLSWQDQGQAGQRLDSKSERSTGGTLALLLSFRRDRQRSTSVRASSSPAALKAAVQFWVFPGLRPATCLEAHPVQEKSPEAPVARQVASMSLLLRPMGIIGCCSHWGGLGRQSKGVFVTQRSEYH